MSAKKLESQLASELIPITHNELDDIGYRYDKYIDVQIVGDKDITWNKIVEEQIEPCDNVHTNKIDDVNHALKRIYKCVTEAKNTFASKTDRRKSGLTVNLANHLYRSVQYGLYQLHF